MKTREELINRILSEWNPIGVPNDIAKTEYTNYIPEILAASKNETSLMNCLENILINKMELDYNELNPLHKKELKQVALQILTVK